MTQPVGHLRLPPMLRQIADEAGLTAALKLAQAKGGTEIYVPRTVKAGHWLAELLGLEEARAICRLYAGENISVPLGLSGAMQNARRTARQALDEGASVAQAARAAGVTERTIYNLRREAEDRRAAAQGNLFDD